MSAAQVPRLVYASLYCDKIQSVLDQYNVSPSKDLARLCESYMELPRRTLYRVHFAVPERKYQMTYEMMALVDNRYELLDLFIAYFGLDLDEDFTEETFYELMQGIEQVSSRSFVSLDPIILYGKQYKLTRQNQIYLVYETHWKHFRDGYRSGNDLKIRCFRTIPSSVLQKLRPYEFNAVLLTGTLLRSGWVFDGRHISLMYKYKVSYHMDVCLGISFSEDEHSDYSESDSDD